VDFLINNKLLTTKVSGIILYLTMTTTHPIAKLAKIRGEKRVTFFTCSETLNLHSYCALLITACPVLDRRSQHPMCIYASTFFPFQLEAAACQVILTAFICFIEWDLVVDKSKGYPMFMFAKTTTLFQDHLKC
jgi:hypothetical protein